MPWSEITAGCSVGVALALGELAGGDGVARVEAVGCVVEGWTSRVGDGAGALQLVNSSTPIVASRAFQKAVMVEIEC